MAPEIERLDERTIDIVGVRMLVRAKGCDKARRTLRKLDAAGRRSTFEIDVDGTTRTLAYSEFMGHIALGDRMTADGRWAMEGRHLIIDASGFALPETVFDTLVGRRVGDVVDMRFFDDSMTILDATRKGRLLDLRVSYARRPLRDVMERLVRMECP